MSKIAGLIDEASSVGYIVRINNESDGERKAEISVRRIVERWHADDLINTDVAKRASQALPLIFRSRTIYRIRQYSHERLARVRLIGETIVVEIFHSEGTPNDDLRLAIRDAFNDLHAAKCGIYHSARRNGTVIWLEIR